MPRIKKGDKLSKEHADKVRAGLVIANKCLKKKYGDKMPWLSGTVFETGPPCKVSPDELLTGAMTYFQSCLDNPIVTNRMLADGTVAKLEKPRVFTWTGLSVAIGMSARYLTDAKTRGIGVYNKEEYADILEWIGNIITTQQLEYAAVGEFNAAVATRLAGLVEKQEVKQDVTTSTVIEVVDEDTKDEIGKIIN